MRTNEILMICCLIFLIISLLASSINKFPEIVKNGSIFIAVVLLAVSQILPDTETETETETETQTQAQAQAQAQALLNKKNTLQKQTLLSIQKIGIQHDNYSGHLFHDLELIMVLFHLSYLNKDRVEIYYLGGEPSKFTIYICKLLFKKPLVTMYKNQKDCYVIDRKNLNCCNINKAFGAYMYHFPYSIWSEKISSNNNIKGFKILYACRQNTSRKLSDKSHSFLEKTVKDFGGTIITDLGKYNYREQIEIFRDHNCLIGVHGNNLSGLMWMLPNSYIMEILPYSQKYKVYDYNAMSMCMRHNYFTIDANANNLNTTYTLTGDQKAFILTKFNILKVYFS